MVFHRPGLAHARSQWSVRPQPCWKRGVSRRVSPKGTKWRSVQATKFFMQSINVCSLPCFWECLMRKINKYEQLPSDKDVWHVILTCQPTLLVGQPSTCITFAWLLVVSTFKRKSKELLVRSDECLEPDERDQSKIGRASRPTWQFVKEELIDNRWKEIQKM